MSLSETPAETIRRAIEQMRERAGKATPGPWGVGNDSFIGTGVEQRARGVFRFEWEVATVPDDDDREFGGPLTDGDDWPNQPSTQADDAAYIASWHPEVALATADLLEAIAVGYERTLAMFPAGSNAARTVATAYGFEDALRLARTYLGETP